MNALVLAYFADYVRATAIAEANSATELRAAVADRIGDDAIATAVGRYADVVDDMVGALLGFVDAVEAAAVESP